MSGSGEQSLAIWELPLLSGSVHDAEYLEKEFFPIINKEDFVNLPKYLMYLKLMIDGTTSNPFSAISLPPT